MAKTDMQVESGLHAAVLDVAQAWKAVEAGQTIETSDQIFFRDWTALCAVLTPKRYALLRNLRQSPAGDVRALAKVLQRDVKRVHADVMALAELGLVDCAEDGKLSSSIDEIRSVIRIAA